MAMPCSSFEFDLLAQDGAARRGRFKTAHGEVETPIFMPVGTQATVKAMTPETLEQLGAQIILGNTYHLYLRPGHENIAALGGLHKFMNWHAPILTDSGGFQAFSLSKLMKVSDEGLFFASHIDGSRHLLTPEKAVKIQEALGSDIMMCLDECIAHPSTWKAAESAVRITTDWGRRCIDARTSQNALFGIVQGGVYHDLRTRSAAELSEMPFDGLAVGGLSVGEGHDLMMEMLDTTVPLLPEGKPRYLMGVGMPHDIVEAVARGVDMFDCVIPTRNARNGMLFTWNGKVVLKQSRYRMESGPPDPNCSCYTCRNFSLAYLRHLYVSGEILASILNTIHNIYFYLELMAKVRHSIEQQNFNILRNHVKELYHER